MLSTNIDSKLFIQAQIITQKKQVITIKLLQKKKSNLQPFDITSTVQKPKNTSHPAAVRAICQEVYLKKL